MSKILKRTGTAYEITDTGQTVPEDGQLIIDPAKYILYTQSDDTLIAIAAGDLIYNDGANDLTLAEAALHLQGSFPNNIGIGSSPPFASKKVMVNGVEKSLFKRVHGVRSLSIPAGTTGYMDLVVPYSQAKFSGAEIFGTDHLDTLDFFILDTDTNTFSGAPIEYPNYPLNQFGFNVEMPGNHGEYQNTSNYDADLYYSMVVNCAYKNNGAVDKIITGNFWLHEVK